MWSACWQLGTPGRNNIFGVPDFDNRQQRASCSADIYSEWGVASWSRKASPLKGQLGDRKLEENQPANKTEKEEKKRRWCHGANGKDFTGKYVGQVTPIEAVATDRHRLDSYSYDLCANQNLLYSAYPDERFRHFRKTFGYANQPLDGIWLRAPYLHNASVPTLRDLLEPSRARPKLFYRGYDVYDPQRVGFVSDVAGENGRKFFLFDTSLPGNGNLGHEGREYGTELSGEEKDAIVEFLKTF